MRLPADAALIVIGDPQDAAVAALEAVWREEGLPLAAIARDDDLEGQLEALGATTLVITGAPSDASIQTMVDRGYRVFVVAEARAALAGLDARFVALETAVNAGRLAKARQRLKAGRSGAG